MSRTRRNARVNRYWLRNPKTLSKVKQDFRYLDAILEEGFKPRPRDMAKANIHGESVVTAWDDIVISSYNEGFNSVERGFYGGEIFLSCTPDTKFCTNVNLIIKDENRVIVAYFAVAKGLCPYDILDLEGKLFGVEKVINPTNVIVGRLN